MANTKISALTSATTPVAGTETLPIVQSGVTKKVTIANLTAGRAVDVGAYLKSSGSTSITYIGDGPTLVSGSGANDSAIRWDGGTASLLFAFGSTRKAYITSGGSFALDSGFFKTVNGSATGYFGDGTSLVSGAGASDSAIRFDGSNLLISYSSTKIFQFASGGDATFSTGNLIQGTASKGINFTANSAAAGMTSQLLNWYEEGTFTPVVAGSTTAGTATYSLQKGRYTRIGRQVYIEVALSWSGGTGTGNFYVTGLPFTSANGGTISGMTIALADFFATTANNVLTGFVPSNTSRVELWQYPTGGGAANNVGYDALAALYFSGSYTV